MHLVPVSRINLTRSTRLSIALREERVGGLVVDMRVQVEDGAGWRATGAGFALSADRLPELLQALEKACTKLPEL